MWLHTNKIRAISQVYLAMKFIKLYFLRGYAGDLRLQPDIPALPHSHQDHANKLLIFGLVKSY